MNAAAVFDYEAAPKELQRGAQCAACGYEPTLPELKKRRFSGVHETRTDRYGFRLAVDECVMCGHVALAERMTPAAYAEFYASGAYRRLVSAFHGREINDETIIPEQREYARRLRKVLKPWERYFGGEDLLDVGGANGVIAEDVATVYQMYPTVLDPAATAPHHIRASAESWEPLRTWNLILLCQTIDHLMEPGAVLEKLRRALAPDGILFVDALDYDITRELKIDHPHNFTERSLMRLLDRTGWTVLNVCRWNRHVGAVCTA